MDDEYGPCLVWKKDKKGAIELVTTFVLYNQRFIKINDDMLSSLLTFCTSVLVVNSFASYYKNRMWRNEVYLKKRERLRHNAGFLLNIIF
jgi:hypothetical protein